VHTKLNVGADGLLGGGRWVGANEGLNVCREQLSDNCSTTAANIAERSAPPMRLIRASPVSVAWD